MSTIYLDVVVLAMFEFCITNAADIPAGVHCDTYINYVKTSDHFRYHPYIVKLHRCAGKDIGHDNYGCLPKTSQEVNLQVSDPMEHNYTDILLKNVTSCEEVCVLKESSCNQYQEFDNGACQCNCKQDVPPSTCQLPFQWERSVCDCKCPVDAKTYICEKKKRFDTELCKCACKKRLKNKCAKKDKMIDPESCQCVEYPNTEQSRNDCSDGGVSKAVVCVIVVAEFVFMIGLFFFCKTYCDDPKKIFRRNSDKTIDSDSCDKDESALVDI